MDQSGTSTCLWDGLKYTDLCWVQVVGKCKLAHQHLHLLVLIFWWGRLEKLTGVPIQNAHVKGALQRLLLTFLHSAKKNSGISIQTVTNHGCHYPNNIFYVPSHTKSEILCLTTPILGIMKNRRRLLCSVAKKYVRLLQQLRRRKLHRHPCTRPSSVVKTIWVAFFSCACAAVFAGTLREAHPRTSSGEAFFFIRGIKQCYPEIREEWISWLLSC